MNLQRLTVEEYNRRINSLLGRLRDYGKPKGLTYDPQQLEQKNREEIQELTDLLNSAIIYMGSGNFEQGASANAVEVKLVGIPEDDKLVTYMTRHRTDNKLTLHLPYNLRGFSVRDNGSTTDGPRFTNIGVESGSIPHGRRNFLRMDLGKPIKGDDTWLGQRPHSAWAFLGEIDSINLTDLTDIDLGVDGDGQRRGFSTPGLSHLHNGNSGYTLAHPTMQHELEFGADFQRALFDLLTKTTSYQGKIPLKGDYHFKKGPQSIRELPEPAKELRDDVYIPSVEDMLYVKAHSPIGQLRTDTLISGPVLVDRANGIADVMMFKGAPISFKPKEYRDMDPSEKNQRAATIAVAEYQDKDDPRVDILSGRAAARAVYEAWRYPINKRLEDGASPLDF
tara:strand:- start:1916 stop:3094 length:1179 start_codon:yes stop_codon:yes gene_type:complete